MDLIKNPDPVGSISSGAGRVVVSPEIGPTYHAIIFKMSGTAFDRDDIVRVEGKLNRKTCWKVVEAPGGAQSAGARIQQMNNYKGGASDAAFFMVDLTEHLAKDIVSELVGVWGTAQGVTEHTWEIEVSGATAPVLESWSLVSGPRPLSKNIHTLEHGTLTVGAAGNHTLALPTAKDGSRLIKRVWLYSTLVTGVTAKKNGIVRHESVRDVNEYVQEHFEGTPASSFYVVDYVVANHTIDEILRTDDATSNSLLITTSAGGNVEYFIESLANIEDLGAR